MTKNQNLIEKWEKYMNRQFTQKILIHIKMPPKDKKYQNYEKLLKLLQKFKLKH